MGGLAIPLRQVQCVTGNMSGCALGTHAGLQSQPPEKYGIDSSLRIPVVTEQFIQSLKLVIAQQEQIVIMARE